MSKLERSAQQTLRHSERLLDEETTTALSKRRMQALATPPKKRLPVFLAPAAGMAAASLVALLLFYPYTSNETNNGIQEDYLTGNAELYEELDFYSWLASNERSMEG